MIVSSRLLKKGDSEKSDHSKEVENESGPGESEEGGLWEIPKRRTTGGGESISSSFRTGEEDEREKLTPPGIPSALVEKSSLLGGEEGDDLMMIERERERRVIGRSALGFEEMNRGEERVVPAQARRRISTTTSSNQNWLRKVE